MKYLSLLFVLAIGCTESKEHHCRWPLCPYKGATKEDYQRVVEEYNGGNNTSITVFKLDSLHLEHPTESREQLIKRLRQ